MYTLCILFDIFFLTDRVCDSSSYNNVGGGTCDVCPAVCVGGCTGNLTTAVQGGCNMCNITLLNSAGMQVGLHYL